MGQIPIGVTSGSNPFVNLVDDHLLPRHLLLAQLGEHGPWRSTTADCEGERARCADRRPGAVSNEGSGGQSHGGRIGENLQFMVHDPGYAFFSS
jgi:hypothetical protein